MGICYRINQFIEENYHKLIDIFLFSLIFISLSLIAIFLIPIAQNFELIAIENMVSVAENILQGTLSLGAIALAVLAYTFSELHRGKSTKERAPYKRIVYIIYLITSLSMADVTLALSFIMTSNLCAFYGSLLLLYIIVVGVSVSVFYWVRQELKK